MSEKITELNNSIPLSVLNGATIFHKLSARLLIVFGLIFFTTALSIATSAQTITPNNLQNWSRADTRPGGSVKFITDATAPSGAGALQLTTDSTTAAKAQFLNPANTLLSSVTSLGYYTKQVSSSFPNGVPSFQLAVYLDGTAATFTNLVYEPYNNGETIIPNTWQQWNPITEDFWSSRTVNAGGACVVTAGAGGPPFYTLANLAANCPNALVVGYGINIGSFNPSYNVEADLVNFNGAIYDFEPVAAVSLVPAAVPSQFDNDYTRINNAVQLVENGATITLNGTFDWTEPNAAASWALGSDGQTGGIFSADDYRIAVPANLNGITFTAASPGAATIQGPGDLAAVNLESVLRFNGGDNQNWTISNIRFVDFDLAIGMFFGAGGTDAFNGTQIINNYILTARDLNATVAPVDVNQNIGIHFAFGANQTISGNTIEIHGDGVSDGANFSTEVGMQSNTSGGNVYNGLQITNNIVRVLNAQSANPQIVLGIWENAHGHSSNINVSGNQFLNSVIGNNPAVNLQRAFRVTSHSSATTTVTYSNNVAEGANIGFQWLAGDNFSANQPVRFTSNVIRNNATGVLVQSQGLATLSFNRIVGNTASGVQNIDGTVSAENNWWGCNSGPGAGGTGCSGTANGTIGTVDASPWLTLRTSATPSSILTGGTSSISSNLNFNSDNVDTSGLGSVPNGTPASFAGTLGTVSPTSGTTTAGVTGTTFTAGIAAGSGNAATTIDGQTVNAPITIAFSCNNISIPTGQTVGTNTQFLVPINIDDTNARGILGYSFTLSYNPAVVTPIGLETVGTLSSGWSTSTNNAPGTLNVVVFNPPMGTPLAGSGILLNVRFISTGAIGTTSNLSLGSFLLNEGIPCAVTSNGDVTVISGSISGAVTYANAVTTTPVPNATITATGLTPPPPAITNGSGLYSLSGFSTGAYTLTPSKTGQINGIGNADATAVAQHIVGFITLNSNQLLAADVSQNGTISSLDATYIAQYTAAIPNPSFTGTWKFIPASRTYPNVQTNQTNQDFSAILLGEVTGNWNPATPLFDGLASEADRKSENDKAGAAVSVNAPANQFALENSAFTVNLAVSNTTGEGIFGYEFDLLYNENVILPQISPCDSVGTVSAGRSVICNAVTPGFLRVVVFSTSGTPMSGAGTLLKLKFNAIGVAGNTSPLTIRNFIFNEGVPQDATTDGQIQLVSPTAASVSVGGQLMSAEGQSIGNEIVVLTNSTGVSRSVRSNSFGFYQFEGVAAGETYTVSVTSKRYTFAPQVVSVTESVTALNLFAESR